MGVIQSHLLWRWIKFYFFKKLLRSSDLIFQSIQAQFYNPPTDIKFPKGIELLLKYKVNPTIVNSDGRTALQAAQLALNELKAIESKENLFLEELLKLNNASQPELEAYRNNLNIKGIIEKRYNEIPFKSENEIYEFLSRFLYPAGYSSLFLPAKVILEMGITPVDREKNYLAHIKNLRAEWEKIVELLTNYEKQEKINLSAIKPVNN